MVIMARNSRNKQSHLRIYFLLLLLLTPVSLLLLPSDYFDQGESICISKLISKSDCPGCGMTRAIQHSLHFDFDRACAYNKLVVVILPLLIIVWFRQISRCVKIIRSERKSEPV